MKKLRSLWLGILLGITAIVAMGIVYIDTTQNYWRFSGGFIQLIVNTNGLASISINTNNLAVGINTNNAGSVNSILIVGRQPATVASGNGSAANNSGRVTFQGGQGGNTTDPTSASGGLGGGAVVNGGAGGDTSFAITNGTGGTGGTMSFSGGAGGSPGNVATNNATGGTGGGILLAGANGATVNASATNTVGGNGGAASLTAGNGATPNAGMFQKGGNGGALTLSAGRGGDGVKTNGGDGASAALSAGNAGSTTSPGNAGLAGNVNISGGNGGTGATNSNGGHVFAIGGSSSATPGNVLLNVNSSGTIRGKTGIRVFSPQESLDVQGSILVMSNMVYTNVISTAATNSTANTNLVIDFNQAVQSITIANHASLTNFVNLPSVAQMKSTLLLITASGGPYNLVWPTLGDASFGVRIYTNANSPIFGTATNTLAVTLTAAHTNLFATDADFK